LEWTGSGGVAFARVTGFLSPSWKPLAGVSTQLAPGAQGTLSTPVALVLSAGTAAKHSVGVVAAYLDKLAKGAEVPIANAGDGRWVKPCSEG